jgi:hypothetical protein
MGQRYPLFREAIGAAKAAAARYHDEQGIKIAAGGGAPGQASMVMFYLRNLAPEEFGESRDADIQVDPRDVSTRITATMTSRQTVEAFMTAVNGVAVGPAGDDKNEARAA